MYAEILDRNQQHLALVQIPLAFFVPVNLPANQLLTITEGSPMIEVLAEESNDVWINVSTWVICNQTHFAHTHLIQNVKDYYIDKGVLVKNRPLVIFIRKYTRDSSGVFLTSEDIDDVISHFYTVACAKILLSI